MSLPTRKFAGITLSSAEVVFIKLLCEQRSYQEIALLMGKNVRTIDGYRDSLFVTLNIAKKESIIIWALKVGIVKLEKLKVRGYDKRRKADKESH